MSLNYDKEIVTVASNHSVDETVQRLRKILEAEGIKLFALIDHSGEAEQVGMRMLPTKLLIFGSPKMGTPVMLQAPSIALDLPLKILIAEDDQGKVWISYTSTEYLRERHGVPQQLIQNLTAIETLATRAAQ